MSCPICKSKLNEIKSQFLINSNKNLPFEQNDIKNEKENNYLVLEENSSVLSGKKSSIIGKISGALLGLVCIVGIILCVIEGGFNISFNNEKLTVRRLTSSNNIYENNNTTNIIIKDEDLDIK